MTRFVDSYLGYLLGQANHSLFREFDTEVRKAGLSSIEWRVLAVLSDSPPLPVSQLAHEVLSKQPTVTKLVQRMVAQKLLRLKADAADQRCTLVEPTAAGRRLVAPLLAKARAHEAQLLKPLKARDVETLKTLLAQIAGAETQST